MNNPSKHDLMSRWHEYLRHQSQVGYEKLWWMGLSVATVVTGLALWALLASK